LIEGRFDLLTNINIITKYYWCGWRVRLRPTSKRRLSRVALASHHNLSTSVVRVHDRTIVGLRWTFSFRFFFLSSSCQNIKVSFHLLLVSNLILIFLLLFVSLSFLIDFFFNFISHHLISFNYYIKLSHHSLNYCLSFFLIEFYFEFHPSIFYWYKILLRYFLWFFLWGWSRAQDQGYGFRTRLTLFF
jgi:hypothetical protein